MKKFILLLLIVVIGKAYAQEPFEGILTMIPDFKTKPESDQQIRVMVKGDKMLMELPMKKESSEPSPKILSDKTTRETYMLMDMNGKKIAMKMNMDMMAGMVGAPSTTGQKTDESPVKPDVTMTGETREIDGYTCKRVLSKMGENTSEAWVTDKISLSTADLFFSPTMGSQSGQFSHLPGMALEAWGINSSGKIVNSIKIKPEPKKLDAALFVIPSDYEKMDMMQMMQRGQSDPQMMQQMMEMMGGKH